MPHACLYEWSCDCRRVHSQTAYEVVIGVESMHSCGRSRRCSAWDDVRPVRQQSDLPRLPRSTRQPAGHQQGCGRDTRAGLALNCRIGEHNRFARKHYFYPDLPKGYQISQYESPICEDGWIDIAAGEANKRVRIKRAHLEEDAGRISMARVQASASSTSIVPARRSWRL